MNPDRPNRYRDFLVRALGQREMRFSIRRSFVVVSPTGTIIGGRYDSPPGPVADPDMNPQAAPGLLACPAVRQPVPGPES